MKKTNKKVELFILTFILLLLTSFNLLATTSQPNLQANIHYISTGNSDCILISDNGHYAMIDGADNDDEQFLVNYLNNLGIKQLDYLILTHPDADHAGGLDAVVKNFAIKQVFVGNGNAETKTYKDFITSCMDKQLQPSVPLPNQTFTLGNGSFQFFNQTSQRDNANDNSLVALYTLGSNKFLFMGDSGKEVEAALPLDKIGKVDILKVGHHGSYSSSSDAFIKAIAPKNAVICCGKDNSYGHPHQVTLDTLSQNKVTTYRTDLNGTIIAETDGTTITIKPTTEAAQEATPKAPSSTSQASSQPTTKPSSKTSTTPTTTTKPFTTVDTSNNQSQTVYVTKTGKKYHQDGCSGLSKSKIPISLEDAKAKGYEPCSKCCK